ncbi:cytochrome C [Sulfurovum lithotrophicum]|uniref:Cytochrome C n=1 Tax=Sulfurovum lithotrophicum TaxID=206403 RepID=A0A7U4M0I0_9BACT|nr:cytochrome c [Sulfurovum lithotrophicum]AKF24625.1 cytochrome C [Sulfurovum lithotrophicum]
MTKMTKLALAALLGMAVLSTTASANPNKGKKIYMKKMKAKCGFSGAKFATKHTQDEWEKIKNAGKFAGEAAKICPGLKLKEKYINDVYDFAHEYASDSGNVPSC